MYYLIKPELEECTIDQIKSGQDQYIAVLTPREWQEQSQTFDLGIDLEFDQHEIHHIKAEVNYDSLTGTFLIPDRNNLTEHDYKFGFALDEKGIIFIDDTGYVRRAISKIKTRHQWRIHSLERFIYDFLSEVVRKDFRLMEKYERELDHIEDEIMDNDAEEISLRRVNEIRGDIRELRVHYEQLLDFAEELDENENNFFREENTRYFRLFISRIERLRDTAGGLRDYTVQVRDLHHTQLDIKQNHVMTILTIVTTIFMPLTLIVGWYGMNFRYMPELESPLGYPAIIAVSLLIIICLLLFFKRKKWL